MQVRCNQNLGFGYLHIKFDEKNLNEGAYKKIMDAVSPHMSHSVIRGTKQVIVVDKCTDYETALMKLLRNLGAKVRRCLDEETSWQIWERDKKWISK